MSDSMMCEMVVCQHHRPTVVLHSPTDTYMALKRYWRKDQEHFLVLTLNGAHAINSIRIASIGLINRTVVHPREVYKWAIQDNSAAIIVAHNHPSGNVEPSWEDRDITNRLVDAGEILGISVLDHLVFSKSGYYSFVEHGILKEPMNKLIEGSQC
jgi:DNA repair protein RadC